MDPALQSVFDNAEALLKQGRWDEVEQLCLRNVSREKPHPMILSLLGVVYAKRGNLEMGLRFLADACAPSGGPMAPRLAAKCIHGLLVEDLASVVLEGLARIFPGEGAFAANSGGLPGRSAAGSAIGSWPYMNEIEVVAMLTALKIPPGPVAALEWGGGHSTFFYSRALPSGSTWNSIEHHREWFDRLEIEPKPPVGAAISLHWVPNSGPFRDGIDDGDIRSFPEYIVYPHKVSSSFKFILVDGRARVECLQEGWKLLTRDGIMVLHDGERPEYRPGHPRDGYRLEVGNPSLKERKTIIFFAKSPDTFRALSQSLREVLPAFVEMTPGMDWHGSL